LLQKLVGNSPNSGTKDATSTLNASAINHASSTTCTGASNTNVKINNYIMWEESSAGKPRQGTETGSGVAAWAWFKRTNIPIRDAAVNMGGGLGPLAANAISHSMQITLAASMLNEPEVQPEQHMTETEIDRWVKRDREFTWFKTLPDAILIKVMDRLSASVNPAPFFRLVIAAEIPTMKDGDLYYPVTEFTAHADKWISTLSDLIKGGWQEGSTNLKQVFLASICTCQLVYDQAKREMHEDVLRLIATLKKWIVVQDNEIQSARAAKASIKNKAKTLEQSLTQEKETDKIFEKRVRALFTSMGGKPQKQAKSDEEKQQPSSTFTGNMWTCQGCGNEWRDEPEKPPRCKKECVYKEHKNFNEAAKYPKGAKPLSWRAYGEAYPPKQQAFFDKKDQMKGASRRK
jgi:rubrerythrin